jgi:hypothetical protein
MRQDGVQVSPRWNQWFVLHPLSWYPLKPRHLVSEPMEAPSLPTLHQYSCPSLDTDNINTANSKTIASTIERQMRDAQDMCLRRKWKQVKSASGKGYPHGFNNDEGLALTTPGPWLEFPVQAKRAIQRRQRRVGESCFLRGPEVLALI